MIIKVQRSAQFKKDYKLVKKRGKDLAKLDELLEKISAGIPLEPNHEQHRLQGDWKPALECHVEPDWVLIWESEGSERIKFLRTGTHSDIFNK